MGFSKKDTSSTNILYELTGALQTNPTTIYREYTPHKAYAEKVKKQRVVHMSDGTILELKVRIVPLNEQLKKPLTTYASLVKLHVGLGMQAGGQLIQNRYTL